jgi:hypothetical protein
VRRCHDHAVAPELRAAAQATASALDHRVHGLLIVLHRGAQVAAGDPPAGGEGRTPIPDAHRDPPNEIGPDPGVGVEDEDCIAPEDLVGDRGERGSLAVRPGARLPSNDHGDRAEPGLLGRRARRGSAPVRRPIIDDHDVEGRASVGRPVVLATEIANQRGQGQDLVTGRDDHADPGQGQRRPGAGWGGTPRRERPSRPRSDHGDRRQPRQPGSERDPARR